MRKGMCILGLTLIVLLVNSWPAGACGDKLLVLGQGVRFQVHAAQFPSRILLYVNPASVGFETFKDANLQQIMQNARHRLDSAMSRKELVDKLQTKRYDIVLADFADAASLEEIIQTAASRPLLLPWVYQPTKAEKSRAEKQYRLVLKAPVRPGRLLSVIDRTMEMKSKMSKNSDSKLSLLR